MKRIVSIVVVLTLMTLASTVAVVPVRVDSVAYAEVSDRQLMDQLTKIKKMTADIEMKMQGKKMMMDAMGRERTMKMLMSITEMLEKIEAQTP